MRVKNLTPFLFAPKLTARKPPQKEMALIVRGAFSLAPGEPLTPFESPLDQGPMSGELFHPDDVDNVGEALYPGDFADYKLSAEVMLKGSCHAPGQRLVRECEVRLRVGAWSKRLRVVGRRVFSDGLIQSASDPIPFVSMPITYANAFGGPGYEKNPVGKGYSSLELPVIEDVGKPVVTRGDRPEPAGFGPLSSAWPGRAGKLGTMYDGAYKKTRAPFYAEDFDWRYFSAAPADQQLEGYLRGDEEVSFENLHPKASSFSVRLPGLRIRAFAEDDHGEVREVRLSLDTLYADLDAGKLILTWRGLTPAREDDLRDIPYLLVASEPLAEALLPDAHYHAILQSFKADPLGVEDHIQKNVPPHLRDATRRVLKGESPIAEPPKDAPPAQAITHMLKSVGVSDEQAAEMQKGVEQAIEQAKPHNDVSASLAQALAAKPSGGPALIPGAAPRVPLAKALGEAHQKLAELKKTAAEQKINLPGLERLEATLSDPRLKQMDPSYAPPGEPKPPPPPEPGPGVDCSGRDLSGQDLSERDLSGADLSGAILSGAKLYKTKLTGANLKGATLASADLESADLSGADLTQANFTEAHAYGARFDGALLDQTFFRKTNLEGASLGGATAKTLFFNECNLTGVKARKVRFYKVVFQGATLTGADLTEADLAECYVMGCEAEGLVAKGASIHKSCFSGSALGRASFAGARGDRTIWLGAKLERADFTLAVLPWALFMDAKLGGARLYGANLKEASFTHATLDDADLERSNLFGANMSRASLSRAKLNEANLYKANLVGSFGAGTTFTGANLKEAMFER